MAIRAARRTAVRGFAGWTGSCFGRNAWHASPPALALLSLTLFAAACATDDDLEIDDEGFDVIEDDAMDDEAFGQMTEDGKADGTLGYQAVALVAKNKNGKHRSFMASARAAQAAVWP